VHFGQNRLISEEFSRYILSFINLNYLSSAFMQTSLVQKKLASEIEVILPLGVLGKSRGETKGEISKIGVAEPSFSFFSLSWGQGEGDGSLYGFCKSHKLKRCYGVNIITTKIPYCS
jgi:hypothetical protein